MFVNYLIVSLLFYIVSTPIFAFLWTMFSYFPPKNKAPDTLISGITESIENVKRDNMDVDFFAYLLIFLGNMFFSLMWPGMILCFFFAAVLTSFYYPKKKEDTSDGRVLRGHKFSILGNNEGSGFSFFRKKS